MVFSSRHSVRAARITIIFLQNRNHTLHRGYAGHRIFIRERRHAFDVRARFPNLQSVRYERIFPCLPGVQLIRSPFLIKGVHGVLRIRASFKDRIFQRNAAGLLSGRIVPGLRFRFQMVRICSGRQTSGRLAFRGGGGFRVCGFPFRFSGFRSRGFRFRPDAFCSRSLFLRISVFRFRLLHGNHAFRLRRSLLCRAAACQNAGGSQDAGQDRPKFPHLLFFSFLSFMSAFLSFLFFVGYPADG